MIINIYEYKIFILLLLYYYNNKYNYYSAHNNNYLLLLYINKNYRIVMVSIIVTS